MKNLKESIPTQSPKEQILSNLHSSKLIGYDQQFREMRGNPETRFRSISYQIVVHP